MKFLKSLFNRKSNKLTELYDRVLNGLKTKYARALACTNTDRLLSMLCDMAMNKALSLL